MGVLTREKLLSIYDRGILLVESDDPQVPFDPEKQISVNSIDLRLSPSALRYSSDIITIDTLNERGMTPYVDAISLSTQGFRLEPHETIFCRTLEQLLLRTNQYLGRVIGRTTFARFGLSVTASQPNLPAGIAWSYPLQITNNTSKALVIYPYTYIAQLQIEVAEGKPEPYQGVYDGGVAIYPVLPPHPRESHVLESAKAQDQLYPEGVSPSMGPTLRKFMEEERRANYIVEQERMMKRRRILVRISQGLLILLAAIPAEMAIADLLEPPHNWQLIVLMLSGSLAASLGAYWVSDFLLNRRV